MSRSSGVVSLIAKRFLLSKEGDSFLSLIAWVSIVGVALGVLALVVVTSVINGFEGELVRVITSMNGEVIMYSRGSPVEDTPAIREKIKKVVPETQAIAESLIVELMVSGKNGVVGGILEGLDFATAGKVVETPRRVVKGRAPLEVVTSEVKEIAIGYYLAERLGVTVGDRISLIAPFQEDRLGAATSSRVLEAEVVGIVRMGMHRYDSRFMFAPLPTVQSFIDQQGKVTSFKMRLSPGVDTRQAANNLTDNFGYPFRAKDWGQLNKNLLYAIQLEKVVIAIILTAIVLVAAFNVVSTLMMMIHDKTEAISILKAMGLRPSQCFKLFCAIGVGIGLIGALAGLAGAIVVNWIIANTNLIDLPADVYYIDFLPVVWKWDEFLMIGLFALAICFFATLYPAMKVMRRPPLDGIRWGE